ncbi:MAG: hypothetical protein V3T30_06160, partial [Thermodesulfobacteriota bacterium]
MQRFGKNFSAPLYLALFVALASFAFSGCATTGAVAATPKASVKNSEIMEAVSALESDNAVVQNIKNGIIAIYAENYLKANKYFEAGLRLDPADAQLHFLNGLSYHLRSLSGNSTMVDLAEAGYVLALRYDPSNYWGAYLLGHIYFDQKRFVDAQNQFSYGLLYSPGHPQLTRALAVASYYAADLSTGSWAAERAYKADPAHISNLRTVAFTRAATGDMMGAKEGLRRYNKSLKTKDRKLRTLKAIAARTVSGRIDDWQDFHKERVLLAAAGESPSVFGSGSKAEGGLLNLGGDADDDSYEPGDDSDTGDSDSGDADNSPPLTRPTIRKGRSSSGVGASGRASGRKASPLSFKGTSITYKHGAKSGEPKLKLPRMTIVDVVILRTAESRVQGKGVNILSGLKATLNGTLYGLSYVKTFANTTRTHTIAPTLTAAGLEYNLNIFNDAYNKVEVLARPSLLATENKMSKFYSGAVLHVQLSSNNTDGSMVDVPIGIHLNVTPKFFDDDTVQITVHAQRGFIETNSEKVGFTAFSQTTETSVDARAVLRFGETLILSGLTENETNKSRDGVPGLQCVPAAQYLFARKDELETKKSVLILITPHKARYLDESVSPLEAKRMSSYRNQQR